MHLAVFELQVCLANLGLVALCLGTVIAISRLGGSTLKPKILIFDKDQAITQQLFWTLCDYYDVVTANDFHAAVRRVAHHEPVVAVLDLNAPAIIGSADSGLRLLDFIKSRLPKARVLGMTSDIFPEQREKYFVLGVDQLLAKPFDTEQLLGLLRRLAPLRSLDAVESGAFKFCY